METMEAIKNRKSVRSYTGEAVSAEDVRAVAQAGNMAAGTPMAGKVYLSAITSRELLAQVSAATKQVMGASGVTMLEKLASNDNFDPMYGAPATVVVSTDTAADPNTQAMATMNAACAGQNMLVAATELGLGSCFLMTPAMAFAVPEVREAAKVPEGAQVQCVIVFGATDDTEPHKAYPEEPENVFYV